MKKNLPTYMLVRKLDLEPRKKIRSVPNRSSELAPIGVTAPKQPKAKGIAIQGKLTLVQQAAVQSLASSPKWSKAFSMLNPRLQKAVVTTFVTEPSKRARRTPKRKTGVDIHVASIARQFLRAEKVRSVGILDLGVWIGGLPSLLELLNAAQTPFTIFEIQSPIPGGMLKTPEGMNKWAEARRGKPLSRSERNQMQPHVVADEFFAAAEDIRRSMGLDFLVGMTPAMVAGVDEDEGIYWNHFSSVSGKTILLSTADLREYAAKAGRPFEAAVGAILVASLLVAVNKRLDYHDNTGCLFDYNQSRISLIGTLKAMQIEKRCLTVMTAEQCTAALAMLSTLKSMKREVT